MSAPSEPEVVTPAGPLRRLARWLRRAVLPAYDLIALQRRRLLRRVESGSTVLDAGCGDGSMALLLAGRGCRVVAVSSDAAALADARRRREEAGIGSERLEFRLHDLRCGPVDGSFDVVLCLDVLEHIRDDAAVLTHLANALRPGGRLLLTVPNLNAPPLEGDHVSAEENGGHVRQGYSREDLRLLLSEAGFEPIEWGSFAGLVTQTAMNVSRRLERRRSRTARILRVAWLAVMRSLTVLDALFPGRDYGLFVEARKRPDEGSAR